jgi:phosphoheptose isomerase
MMEHANEGAGTSGQILEDLFSRHPELSGCRADITAAFGLLRDCYEGHGKLLVCGNGGSAADSEHIVGELMKSFKLRRPVGKEFEDAYRAANQESAPGWLEGALPAISLVSQTSLSTAFANDETGEGLFAQQVLGYGRPEDVLLGISTSGNSKDVVAATKVARALGMRTIGLTGARESALSALADVCIRVPETETFKVQELHLPIYHALCAALETHFFGSGE